MDAAFGPAGSASVARVGAIGSRAGQWVLAPAGIRTVAARRAVAVRVVSDGSALTPASVPLPTAPLRARL